MDKHLQSAAKTDIADEPYHGPSPRVTAAGQGVFDHLKWAAIGIGLVLPFGLSRPNGTQTLLTNVRSVAERMKQTPVAGNFFARAAGTGKQVWGGVLHGLFGEGTGAISQVHIDPKHAEWFGHVVMDKERGFTHAFMTHTVGLIPGIGKPFKNWLGNRPQHVTDALTLSGIAGLGGYIAGWGKALIYGGEAAHTGRHQFERAQKEIRDQRAINDGLLEKYVETKLALEDLKTTKAAEKGTLRVAPDAPPPAHDQAQAPAEMTPPPEATHAPAEPTAPKSTVMHEKQHHGNMAAAHASAPEFA